MSFCLMTEPLQHFWPASQEIANMTLQINCPGRARWAASRAERCQARAASRNRGHGPTADRARLGKGQLPQGPNKARLIRSSRSQGQTQDWRAGYDTNSIFLLETELELSVERSYSQHSCEAHPRKTASQPSLQEPQPGTGTAWHRTDKGPGNTGRLCRASGPDEAAGKSSQCN